MLSSFNSLRLFQRTVLYHNNVISITKNIIINNKYDNYYNINKTSSLSLITSPLSLSNNIISNIYQKCNNVVINYQKQTIGFLETLLEGIWNIKRTFQPSLRRMKNKHGFLARVKTNNGKKVLNRRRMKNRRRLCA